VILASVVRWLCQANIEAQRVVPRDLCWNLRWHGLRLDEDIGSGSKVNRLINEVLVAGFPASTFRMVMTSGEQRPEQHGGSFGRRQHRLWLDAALELLMEPFDCISCPRGLPLAGRQSGEGKEPVTGFLEAVGHRLALEPSFADEGPPAQVSLSVSRLLLRLWPTGSTRRLHHLQFQPHPGRHPTLYPQRSGDPNWCCDIIARK
jgi:hypothetical protein